MLKIREIVFIMLLLLPVLVSAEEGGFSAPERRSLGLTLGHSYDPSPTFGFLQITGVLQYDYDRVWPHRAPEPLYFKVEASLGLADYSDNASLITSANMLAQYYFRDVGSSQIRPYIEAGIGLIYTDFKVEGQGLRFNFNPQAGLGCDFRTKGGEDYFVNIRLHHLSNGDLYHDNRGVNAMLFQLGRWF